MAQTRFEPQDAAQSEALVGTVERVTFHNAETGFAVLKVKARGKRDLITVIGHAAAISAGEFVNASGVWVNDRAHGLQFSPGAIEVTAQPLGTTVSIVGAKRQRRKEKA